jgi:hypothetical protein
MSTGSYRGEYSAPKHKASTVRGSYMSGGDSVGVEDGLSKHHSFDSNTLYNVKYNNTSNPVNGNVRQVPKPYVSKSVTEKGHKMNIC